MLSAVEQTLVDQGAIEQAELTRLQEVSAQTGISMAELLPQLGLVSEIQMVDAIASATHIEAVAAESFPDQPYMPEGISLDWLRKHHILPLAKRGSSLNVAMADPTNEASVNAIAFASKLDVTPKVARASDIDEQLSKFGTGEQEDTGNSGNASLSGDELERLLDGSSEAPVIRLVNSILGTAVRRGASDVHIEPMARHLAVRLRLDGRLVEIEQPPRSFSDAVASRIKVMAALDISETRLPQDGRILFTYMGEDVDIRVSTSPVAHGESIVLRLLGRSHVPPQLDAIGLPYDQQAMLKKALSNPNGMILLTGPTGSGKTTTLYAGLNHLRRPDVKILTVEDPVEILLDGVNQVQVQPDIGLDYAGALRAFLRQDPDILMIGEIRDRDTADIALRAALTGHLVLSTLHTNSALGAFTRLGDIGIDNYLAASTVTATIAQRLLRKICGSCGKKRRLTTNEKPLFDVAGIAAPTSVYDASGCTKCSGTGYQGRLPVMEFIAVGEELRGLIDQGRASAYEFNPKDSLHGRALALVADGQTSLDEALRVTGSS